jgi:predicted oxidoreductase (fatty acid repression mutant protein)
VRTLPHTLKEEIMGDKINDFINIIIRKIPTPPSFNSTAARIIEPPKGASTCAFGSHK